MKLNDPLLTDLYQLTMAQGYWECGKADTQACFHMFFRDYPFNGGYAVACGMAQLADLVEDVQVLQEAKEGAEWLLNDDPGLQKTENRGILDHVRVQFEDNENRLN